MGFGKALLLSRRFLVCAAMALASRGVMALAGQVDVTPTSMGDWTFYTRDSGGTFGAGTGTGDIVTGPATPPIGTGSAHFQTPSGGGDQDVELRNTDYNGTLLSSLTTLSYYTYATAWNGAQLPWLDLYINTTGGTTAGSWDDRLVFEPVYSNQASTAGDPFGADPYPDQGPVALNVWQQWNVMQGMFYADNEGGPGNDTFTLSQYLALFPNATIVNDTATRGGIRFSSGFASASDDFNANVDAFAIGTAGGTTTYNFDPAGAPVPLPSTAWTFLTLIGGVAAFGGLKRFRASPALS